MPENQIYKFMKENGLTTKDEATFLQEYSSPDKARELHKFMTENELTTKDETQFYNEYFSPKGASSGVGAASVGESNAPQEPSSSSGVSSDYQQKLNKMNFVQRMNDPSKFIQNPDGTRSTHKMASANVDNKNIAFPTIVEKDGKLVELSIDDAIDHAMRTGEYAEFATEKDAQQWAELGLKKS